MIKLVNIDAPTHLSEKVVNSRIPEFVMDVVRPLERGLYNRFIGEAHEPHKKDWKHFFDIIMDLEGQYENIVNLLHSIPVCLRNSKSEADRDDNRGGIIDLLGAYFPNQDYDNPYIELYLTDIDVSTKNNEEHFKWLFTKVLFHELAHAALDIYMLNRNRQEAERVSYKTEFGRWREESMANAVALRIIKDFGNKDFYDYAKNYMQTQPKEYALGVLMEDFGYWDFRSVFQAKEDGVDSTLQQEWLKYVKGTPDWEGMKKWNELLNSQNVYIFEGKYYSSEEVLVFDIVNKVLSDYVNKNGNKMPFNTFSSLFPYIRTGAEMSYEPTQKVIGDSRYKELRLVDGNYSLYYFWDNGSLHAFVDAKKLHINIIEYKNY